MNLTRGKFRQRKRAKQLFSSCLAPFTNYSSTGFDKQPILFLLNLDLTAFIISGNYRDYSNFNFSFFD